MDDMERLVARDPVVAAKVMQVARSPLYGGGAAIDSLRRAIVHIGFEGTRNAIFMVTMHAEIARGGDVESQKRLWKHSLACAATAQRLARPCGAEPDAAFLAGLLHDIGRAAAMAAVQQIQHRQPALRDAPAPVVQEAIDSLHVPAGVFLARRWGLADPIVQAIGKHHDTPDQRDLAALVAFSCLVAKGVDGTPAIDWALTGAQRCMSVLGLRDSEVAHVRLQVVEELVQVTDMFG